MKQKYYIGNLEFKSKKACADYARNKINNLGRREINKTHLDFNFFNDLIKNHPTYIDKIGVGIDYFYIQHNPI